MSEYQYYMDKMTECVSRDVNNLIKLDWRDIDFQLKTEVINNKLWFFYNQVDYIKTQKFKEFKDEVILSEYYSLLKSAIEYDEGNERLPDNIIEKLSMLQSLIEGDITTDYDRKDTDE